MSRVSEVALGLKDGPGFFLSNGNINFEAPIQIEANLLQCLLPIIDAATRSQKEVKARKALANFHLLLMQQMVDGRAPQILMVRVSALALGALAVAVAQRLEELEELRADRNSATEVRVATNQLINFLDRVFRGLRKVTSVNELNAQTLLMALGEEV